MKTAETKTTASNQHIQHRLDAGRPFFQKKGESSTQAEAESSFFGVPQTPFFPSAGVQTKLKIGRPGDRYEQEADAVADRVVKQINTPAPTAAPAPTIQRVQTLEGEEGMQEKEEVKEEAGEEVQRKPIFESEGIQSKSNGGQDISPPEDLSSRLGSSAGGDPLPNDTRENMESAMGADFSGVRVHTGTHAVQMSQDLGAQAFTHGKDIYFNEGKYDPSSSSGQHLLAHELTHTVQQGASKPAVQKKDDENEDEPIPWEDIDEARADGRKPLSKAAGTLLGKIEKSSPRAKRKVRIILYNFSLKDQVDTSQLPPPYLLPKSRSRKKNKTEQIKIWKEDSLVLAQFEKNLKKVIGTTNEMTPQTVETIASDDSKLFQLEVKGHEKTNIVGNYDQILDLSLIPTWNHSGKPARFQVEHMLEYQIAGKDTVDNIKNLYLLKGGQNHILGQVTKKEKLAHISAVLEHYRTQGREDLTNNPRTALSSRFYEVKIQSIDPIPLPVSTDNAFIEDQIFNPHHFPLGDQFSNPIRSEVMSVKLITEPPEGKFILKTNPTKAGVLIPYSAKKFKVGSYILTVLDEDFKEREVGRILAELDVNTKNTKKKGVTSKEVSLTKVPGQISTFHAADRLGNIIKLADLSLDFLSPLEFEQIDVDPGLNLTASGKVLSDIPFFEDADIQFIIDEDGIRVAKTFGTGELKLPSPFRIDSTSLEISVGTQGFMARGSIAFGIENVGEGSVSAHFHKRKGLRIRGDFNIASDLFDRSTIDVSYQRDPSGNEQYSIGGDIALGRGKVKGVKKASLRVDHSDGVLSGEGTVELAVSRGIEGGRIGFVYNESASGLKLTVDARLVGIPGIENAEVAGEISTGGDDTSGDEYRFSISADIDLNFKLPGLDRLGVRPTNIRVTYDSETEIFNVTGKILIERPKLNGDVTLGVTNAKVDEAGQAVPGEKGNGFSVYGNGDLDLTIVDGRPPITIGARLTPEGEVFLSASLPIDLQIGEEYNLASPSPIVSISTPSIPIASIGVAQVLLDAGGSISLYAKVKPLTIEGHFGIENVNLAELESAELVLSAAANIGAEAGVTFDAWLRATATAAIIYVSGSVAVEIEVGAEANAGVRGDLRWSYARGLSLTDSEAYMEFALRARATLELRVEAGIYYYIGRKSVWDEEFPLASKDFPDLAAMKATFPVSMNNGELNPISIDQMQVKENPLDDTSYAGKYMQSAVTGDKLEPKKVEPKEYQKELIRALRELPQISPFSGEFTTERGRYFFIEEVREYYGEYEARLLEEELVRLEYEEFNDLRMQLMSANQSFDIATILSDFHINHPKITHEDLDQLTLELEQKNQEAHDELSFSPVQDGKGQDESLSIQQKAISDSEGFSAEQEGEQTEEGSADGLESRLNGAGQGHALPEDTRAQMEDTIGADFSGVRVHTDANASNMNQELGSYAFTHGEDIYFNDGQYNPDSPEGKRLLAHELTHTVQQGAASEQQAVSHTGGAQVQRFFGIGSLLNSVARHIPGYTLITTIIGKNPLTGDTVPRTTENLLTGFLGLVPGGTVLADQLKKTGALPEAGRWLTGQVAALNITFPYIVSLIERVKEEVSITKGISGNIEVAKRIFGEPWRRIKRFVGNIAGKIKEFVFTGALKLVGAPVKLVMAVLNKGKAVLSTIISDPIGFFKNLAGAVGRGIRQFVGNIKKHLVGGLVSWLTGAMADLPIEMPAKFDLKGVLHLTLQILGLTYDRIRKKIVKVVGEKPVALAEKGMAFLKRLVVDGPIALWEMMKEKAAEIKQSVMDGIRNWVVIQVVKSAVVQVLSMLNPAGALVQAAMKIYQFIMFLHENLSRIADFVKSIFSSIGEIARGAIKSAANFIELTMAKAIPIMLSFLARLINLGGIGKAIKKIITKIRKPIDKVVDKVIKFVAKKIKKLFGKKKDKGGKNHKKVASQAIAAMKKGGQQAKDYKAFRQIKETQAQNIEKQYGRKLKKGIGLKIKFEDAKKDPKDQKLDFRVVIAPNTIEAKSFTRIPGASLPAWVEEGWKKKKPIFVSRRKKNESGKARESGTTYRIEKIDFEKQFVLIADTREGSNTKEGLSFKHFNEEVSKRLIVHSNAPNHKRFKIKGKPEKKVSGLDTIVEYQTEAGKKFKVKVGKDNLVKEIEGFDLELKSDTDIMGRGVTEQSKGLVKGKSMNSSHLIADEFGGSGYAASLNLVTASTKYNQEVMSGAESSIKRFIRHYNAVKFNLKVQVAWGELADDKVLALILKRYKDENKGLTKENEEDVRKEIYTKLKGSLKTLKRVMGVTYLVSIQNEQGKVFSEEYSIGADTYLGVEK